MNNVNMEKERINVAEILRNCQTGMNLFCVCFENVVFDRVDDNNRIRCFMGSQRDEVSFDEYGRLNGSPSAKCVIFPKGLATWEDLRRPFKDGDIVASKNGSFIGIVKVEDGVPYDKTYCAINSVGSLAMNIPFYFDRFATEEEKQKLFNTIKANGYRWNSETKTLEDLPKFKVSDKIKNKTSKSQYVEVTEIKDTYYTLNDGSALPFTFQDEYELVCPKFNISSLKPFDRVLVRNSDDNMWCASMFSHTWKGTYLCAGMLHTQCIPYEGNEHLCGTTGSCDEFFRTWGK